MTGISEDLVNSIIAHESGGDPYAMSKTKAAGLMQLEPATARELGVTNRFDPEQNKKGGTKYIGQLIDKYKDPETALIAYNWGQGNVDKFGVEKAPTGSKEYAKKVLAKAGASNKDKKMPSIDEFLDAVDVPTNKTSSKKISIDDFLGDPDDKYSSEEYENPNGKGVPLTKEQIKRRDSFMAAHRQASEKSGVKPEKEPGLLDKLKGAGEAALAAGSGMVGGVVGSAAGLYHGLTSGKYGTSEGAREAEQYGSDVAKNWLIEPKTEIGKKYTSKIGEVISDSGISGLPIGGEMAAVGALAKPAARQISQAISASPEVYMLGKAAEKFKGSSVVPKLDPEKAALAKKALDMGIEIPFHSMSDNSFVKMAGEFIDNLPLSGSTKAKNRESFNNFLNKQIGGDIDVKALTPAVFARAQRKSGKVIGDTFNDISVPLSDAKLSEDIKNILQAQKRELDPTKSIITGNVDELSRIASDNGGVIPGSALKKLHSEVLAKLRGDLSAHPGMREQLSDFQGILEDAADRQITDPSVKEAYNVARTQYAKSKVLEPLVAKGGVDGVSPQALLGRMNSTNVGKHRMATGAAGDLGDAAQVAQKFMKEQPSSRTAERGFLMGAATELAGAGKAALGIGLGNIYNRFGPRIAKRIVEGSLPEEASSATKEIELAPLSPHNEGYVKQPKPYKERGLLSLKDEEPNVAPGSVKGIDYPSKLRLQQPGEITPQKPYSGPLELVPKDESVPSSQRFANRSDVPSIPGPNSPLNKPSVLELRDKNAAPTSEPAEKLMTKRHDLETHEFELRQEVLQRPEFSKVIDAYKAEAELLRKKVANAISTSVRSKAEKDLRKLEDDFSAGMKSFGIDNPQEATGLRRPLYESGTGKTKLPIKKTYTMSDGDKK